MLSTLPTDTLALDPTLVATWQSNPMYQYNRELLTPEMNIFEWLYRRLIEWLDSLLGSGTTQQYTEVILVCIGIVLFLLIAWLVYCKNPGLFIRNRRGGPDYTVEADTIYGIDFARAIGQAVQHHDYREAGRLLYLQTLKQLSDDHHIDWQPYKTPTEYLREVRQPMFRQLTNHFLRVRYGNFEATEELFHAMADLQRKLFTALSGTASEVEKEQKGGPA
ncbi:MAG: DUF4129 domain-containing protein [Mediterranea sp.]|jgi:hypothetical protein|nr:DUF4129 domain-containing protein [Mediterranea sp.]